MQRDLHKKDPFVYILCLYNHKIGGGHYVKGQNPDQKKKKVTQISHKRKAKHNYHKEQTKKNAT